MILTGNEIIKQVKNKNIFIENFDEGKANPNSYNLTLNDTLLVYTNDILDMKKPNSTKEIKIPKSGLLLKPGELYLGKTNERTFTNKYVPMLEGRSSIGRLGIYIHVTAGFGDIGFNGNWTLEIQCIKPVLIYPNIEICQIYYHTPEGDLSIQYNGKYQNDTDVNASKIYKDFAKELSKDEKVIIFGESWKKNIKCKKSSDESEIMLYIARGYNKAIQETGIDDDIITDLAINKYFIGEEHRIARLWFDHTLIK